MRGLAMRLLGPLVALVAMASASVGQELRCEPVPDRSAGSLAGEVAGSNGLTLPVGPGYTLALLPAAAGWDLRVFDPGGIDLSQITPPLHGPNARQLYGWHFRNADNTGPNDGSVNAPQHLRLFLFEPNLTGTAGIKPSGEITPEDAEKAGGRGWLRLLDIGLADLDPGQQARMTYLKFEACLTWPSNLDMVPIEEVVTTDLIERFGACGLPTDLALEPYLNTASLEGDFDGDGSLDIAAPVTRQGDGKRAVAVCRAGTWLDIVGLDGEIGELVPAYFDHIDWWNLHPADTPVGTGATGEPVPTLHGDGIVIGKEDSSSVIFFWTPEGYASYWQGD